MTNLYYAVVWMLMFYTAWGSGAFAVWLLRKWWYSREPKWELVFESLRAGWLPAPNAAAVPDWTGRYTTADSRCVSCGDRAHHHRWWGSCHKFWPKQADVCGAA